MPRGRRLSLRLQFLGVAAVVLLSGMLGTGWWMIREIEAIVTDNAGAVTALYVDAVIAPAVQEPESLTAPGTTARQRLDHLLAQGDLSREIRAFKLWNAEGRTVYSTRPGLEGRMGAGNPRFQAALSGRVVAVLREVQPEGIGASGQDPVPVLEVYSPIRSAKTGEVIAVAEFYSSAEGLRRELASVRFRGWLLVGLVTLAMFLVLYGVVARGDRVIAGQRRALDRQIETLSGLLKRNEALTQRVDQANARMAGLNEATLRRLSADIHDGPAQLLAFAALRLDEPGERQEVRAALDEALKDLRLICRGMALPELADWTAGTIARRLTASHAARSGREVRLSAGPDLPDLALPAKNCIYRFIQEALNNAARHAPGAALSLDLRREGEGILIALSDDGPGFDPKAESSGLGLPGLRERVAGLKGRFWLESGPAQQGGPQQQGGQGTRIAIWLPSDPAGEVP